MAASKYTFLVLDTGSLGRLMWVLLVWHIAGVRLSPSNGGSDDGYCICEGYESGTLLQDCTDSRGYYACMDNTIEHWYCDFGELFDPNWQACIPENCPPLESQSSTPTPTSSTPTPTSTTPTPTSFTPTPTSTPITISTPTLQSSECPTDHYPDHINCQYHGQIIPDPQHCRLFWTCFHETPVCGFCQIGLWFHPVHFVCDFPYKVKCPAKQD